jgi:hypothetical protein
MAALSGDHIHTLSPTHFLPRAAAIEPNVSNRSDLSTFVLTPTC